MVHFVKRLIGFLAIGSALLAACKSSDATPTYVLGINQSARLSSDVVIRVDSIRDGRCPNNPNISCITGGTASAKLTISKDSNSYQRRLYVGPDSYRYGRGADSTVVSFDNLTYRIILQDITPYPMSFTLLKDQRAFMVISRL